MAGDSDALQRAGTTGARRIPSSTVATSDAALIGTATHAAIAAVLNDEITTD